MSKRIEEVIADLREIKNTLLRHEIILDRNTHSLEDHIAGVNTLKDMHKELSNRVKPIEDHVIFLRKLGRLMAVSVSGIAALAAILKVLY